MALNSAPHPQRCDATVTSVAACLVSAEVVGCRELLQCCSTFHHPELLEYRQQWTHWLVPTKGLVGSLVMLALWL